jgi:hypothetical protein
VTIQSSSSWACCCSLATSLVAVGTEVVETGRINSNDILRPVKKTLFKTIMSIINLKATEQESQELFFSNLLKNYVCYLIVSCLRPNSSANF